MRRLLLSALCITVFTAKLAPAAQGDAHQPGGGECASKHILSFTMDATGNVSDKGKSVEGPVCIEVHFNPLQYRVSIATVETRAPGPDLQSAVLGKAGQGGLPPETATRAAAKEVAEKQLSTMFAFIYGEFQYARPILQAVPLQYNAALDAQTTAITGIRTLLSTTTGISASTPALADAIVNNFKGGLGGALNTAKAQQGNYLATDKSTTAGPSLLTSLQQIQNELSDLPFKYSTGDKVDPGDSWGCQVSNAKSVGWSDWYGRGGCKDLYDRLQKEVQDAIATAQQYASVSENVKGLQAKASIVNYWIALFKNLGLAIGSSPQASDIQAQSVTRHDQGCGTIFNQSSSTAVSLVIIDQTPTLDGNSPGLNKPDAFMTVTCGTRFSVSGGFGFSTIRQREFAIVKSAGGQNNTSVNKFGTLSDSPLHPLPMALVHARLAETPGHRVAVHATVGIAGNLQGQASGGSSAEFLLGGTVSFLRTLYFSAGLHIGTKPELAGGFKEGDTVPTDITSIQGQVKRSYTTGFGFAVSFSKP